MRKSAYFRCLPVRSPSLGSVKTTAETGVAPNCAFPVSSGQSSLLVTPRILRSRTLGCRIFAKVRIFCLSRSDLLLEDVSKQALTFGSRQTGSQLPRYDSTWHATFSTRHFLKVANVFRRICTGATDEHRQISPQYLLTLLAELSPELEGR